MPYNSNQRYVVNVPKRSGFDKSHRNSGTGTCGTLIPLLCDEVVPNTRLSLKLNLAAQMPPLASDTYMNVRLKAEAFFVPSRLLCASFEDFFCDFPRRVYTGSLSGVDSSGSFTDVTAALPVFQLSGESASVPSSIFGAGSLLDYLGVKISSVAPIASGDYFRFNPLPLVAYHLVWQEFYRNPRVQNPAFSPNLGSVGVSATYLPSSQRIPSLPFNYYHRAFTPAGGSLAPDNTVRTVDSSNLGEFLCADGVSIFSLRQRNFGLDYFTGARVSAQQGAPQGVNFTVDDNGDGSISIAAIRAANSLQQFRERNNLPSPRLVDQVKVRYNANLSDGVAQRPICIGSASYDMSSTGVNQTAPSSVQSTTKNPFSSVAAQYGRAYGAGSDFIISDFTANEPGYILVLISQVPEVSYSYGVLPMFRRYLTEGSITDMACSLLQNVGDQPIYQRELMNVPNSLAGSSLFGFTDRYADWMFLPNQVHGLFRDGSSLESFVAQRALEGATELSSAFLEIPKDYLNSVLATNVEASGLTYWYDCKLDYFLSMPLAEYSIPSLQDPAYEHGERVSIRRNGQIF